VTPVDVRERQGPLRQRYTEDPSAAQIVLRGGSAPSPLDDPLHCAITLEVAPDAVWRSGAHAAVGGDGAVPCSADLLLGALAACQEVTLRMVAANMGIELESLTVTAEADWDARGTIAMRDAPIGLKAVRCRTRVVKDDGKGDRSERLLRSAEKCCVVLSTLRGGVPVEATFELGKSVR
jgi:uncharacterized OsmC-like protein